MNDVARVLRIEADGARTFGCPSHASLLEQAAQEIERLERERVQLQYEKRLTELECNDWIKDEEQLSSRIIAQFGLIENLKRAVADLVESNRAHGPDSHHRGPWALVTEESLEKLAALAESANPGSGGSSSGTTEDYGHLEHQLRDGNCAETALCSLAADAIRSLTGERNRQAEVIANLRRVVDAAREHWANHRVDPGHDCLVCSILTVLPPGILEVK